MRMFLQILLILFSGCARNWVNYPPMVVDDGKGGQRIVAARAAEFNGSDLEGDVVIGADRNGIYVSSSNGINNSRSTAEGYRTARYGAATIGWTAFGITAARSASAAVQGVNSSNNAANVAGAKAGAGVATTRINAGVTKEAIKAGLTVIPR